MRRWLDPRWYEFLWRRAGRRGSAAVLVLVLGALALGGYLAARTTKSSNAAVTLVRVQPVKQKVRVHGHVRLVTRYVTLSTTEVAQPSTVVQTRVVTRPVAETVVETVQAVRVRSVPVVRRRLVYVTGKGSTVTRQRTETQTQTQTQTQVTTQTNFETITQPTTVASTRRVTVTAPANTVTVTGAVITVTLPAKTVTVTRTVTSPPPPPPPTKP